jgi:hypothetical protein
MAHQSVVRLHTGGPVQTSSQWRHALRSVPALVDAPWDDLAVFQSESAVSVVARSPAGSAWLETSSGLVFVALLDLHGKVGRVERLTREVGLRTDSAFLWAYRIPRLVVDKKGRHWSELSAADLDAPARARLLARLRRDLQTQIVSWGLGDTVPRITLVDTGRPMPLTGALCGATNHSGVDLAVLARLDVRLVSDARFEGDWFAGLLPGLGFGRLFRNGYATRDELLPQHLVELGLEIEA